jgi:hypothetical protein
MKFSEIFGQSSMQENFNKCTSLKWELTVNGFDYFEYSFNDNTINKKNISSLLVFNFTKNILLIHGDLAKDVFKEGAKFHIVKVLNQGIEPEYELIEEYKENILKLIVKRNYLIFENTLSNWNCKISKNITIDISQLKITETQLTENKKMNQQNALSILFPNFVSLINESAIYLQNIEKSNDNSIKLEYKVPILTFGQVMGYDFYNIEKDHNNEFYYYQYRISKNGGSPIYSSKKKIFGDQSIDRYRELFKEILLELMINPNYRSIATGGF